LEVITIITFFRRSNNTITTSGITDTRTKTTCTRWVCEIDETVTTTLNLASGAATIAINNITIITLLFRRFRAITTCTLTHRF